MENAGDLSHPHAHFIPMFIRMHHLALRAEACFSIKCI
jgi:hypothetical protein